MSVVSRDMQYYTQRVAWLTEDGRNDQGMQAKMARMEMLACYLNNLLEGK
jgi:hypothetical protein